MSTHESQLCIPIIPIPYKLFIIFVLKTRVEVYINAYCAVHLYIQMYMNYNCRVEHGIICSCTYKSGWPFHEISSKDTLVFTCMVHVNLVGDCKLRQNIG
jgi:hypothetical protein